MDTRHAQEVKHRPESATPSTASRIKARTVENAFPTPPRRSTAQTIGRMSPIRAKLTIPRRAASTPPEHPSEGLDPYRAKATRATTVDHALSDMTWQQKEVSKRNSRYFDGAFAIREASNTIKDRVIRDSVIIVETKLNCHIESEHDYLIDLSFRLSEIYQRPISSILALTTTDVHMLMSGSAEPAYYLTITALPSDIAATKNKRSTHLLQSFIDETLSIAPNRGVLRFQIVPEDSLATNGVTAHHEIERLEQSLKDETHFDRSLSRQTHRMAKSSKATLNPDRSAAGTPHTGSAMRFPGVQSDNVADEHVTPMSTFSLSKLLRPSTQQRVGKRKSVMGFKFLKFGRDDTDT